MSPLRVIKAYILGAFAAFVVVPWGVFEISRARPIVGTAALLFAAMTILSAVLWRKESGKVALALTSEGINDGGRLVPWDRIADVEACHGGDFSRGPSILLTLKNGEKMTIRDDYFDHSIDELCFEIKKRIETHE